MRRMTPPVSHTRVRGISVWTRGVLPARCYDRDKSSPSSGILYPVGRTVYVTRACGSKREGRKHAYTTREHVDKRGAREA